MSQDIQAEIAALKIIVSNVVLVKLIFFFFPPSA